MKPDQSPNQADAGKIINSLRDLSDFCVNWKRLKPVLSEQTLNDSEMPDEAKALVIWLIEHADRTTVLPRD